MSLQGTHTANSTSVTPKWRYIFTNVSITNRTSSQVRVQFNMEVQISGWYRGWHDDREQIVLEVISPSGATGKKMWKLVKTTSGNATYRTLQRHNNQILTVNGLNGNVDQLRFRMYMAANGDWTNVMSQPGFRNQHTIETILQPIVKHTTVPPVEQTTAVIVPPAIMPSAQVNPSPPTNPGVTFTHGKGANEFNRADHQVNVSGANTNIGGLFDGGFSERYLGVAPDGNLSLAKHFNRYKLYEGIDFRQSAITYVFFTRPCMNLITNPTIQDDFIRYLQTFQDPSSPQYWVLRNLDSEGKFKSQATAGQGNPFNTILSNLCTTLELRDNTISQVETGQNLLGNKLVYADSQTEAMTVNSMSIDYYETSDMMVTMLHKCWVDYMHLVKRNLAVPHMGKRSFKANSQFYGPDGQPSKHLPHGAQNESASAYASDSQLNVIHDRIIDYACSIYVFKMAEDGRRVKFWTKYTGVFPTSVPYSTNSFSLGETTKPSVSIEYTYSFKEDMSPEVLLEFQHTVNSISKNYDVTWGTGSMDKTTLNKTLIEDNWVGLPYLEYHTWNNQAPLLKFNDKKDLDTFKSPSNSIGVPAGRRDE